LSHKNIKMRILKSYTSGWNLNIETIQNTVILYVTNFFLAFLLGLTFLSSVSSDSLLFDKLFKGFDFTAFVEFMRSIKSAIPFLRSQFFILLLVFSLLSTFFTGGILDSFFKEGFNQTRFWTNSGKFFFRLFRLSIYTFILYAIAFALSFVPLAFIFDNLNSKSAVETTYILPTILLIVLFIVLSSFVFIISDYSKIIIYLTEPNYIVKSIWRSTKFIFKNFFKTYTLFLLLMIVPIVLAIIYYSLNSLLGSNNLITLSLTFLIGQAFIFGRIFSRIWIMGSQYEFYTFFFNKNIEYKKAEFYALDEKAETISQIKFNEEKTEIRKNKEEKANTVINDVNSVLQKIQNQIDAIEMEVRPEIKEELINKLIESTETEEWEIFEEKTEDSKDQLQVNKVLSLVDEIKQEKIEKEKEEKLKSENKLSNKIITKMPYNQKDEDIFDFEN